jgi:hypothetical protein
VNPEIIERNGEVRWEEGCLSFPGVHEEIDRAERVKVRAQDRDGKPFELEADGLLAIAIQHENDHLDGKLMVDHLGLIKRRLVHRQMVKRATEAAQRTAPLAERARWGPAREHAWARGAAAPLRRGAAARPPGRSIRRARAGEYL